MNEASRFLKIRHFGAAFVAAAIGVGAWLIPPQNASAATVTLANSTANNCTFTSFSGDSSGNLRFDCSGGGTPLPGFIWLSLAGTASSLSVGATTTFAVVRSLGTAGAATGNLAVSGTGGCTLSPTTVTFADGSSSPSPATVTVTAGQTPGNCTITLTAGGTALLGSQSQATISVVAASAGSLALNLGSTASTLVPGASTALAVSRTGGTAGAVSGNLTSSGCSLSAPVVSFAGGSTSPTPATITVTATGAAGTSCTIDLAAAGASLGAPSRHVIAIENPGQGACTTTADETFAFDASNRFYAGPAPGRTATAPLAPPADVAAGRRTGSFLVVDGLDTPSSADIQFSVSRCPGDFVSTSAACVQHTRYSGGSMVYSIGPKPAGTPWYMQVCELPAGTTPVYFNFRQIRIDNGQPSCSNSSCPTWVQAH